MAIFADEFRDMMSGTITVQTLIGRGDDGAPVYATPVSYKALIENNVRSTIGKDGQIVAAKGRVYIDTVDPIGANDLVTFDDSQVPVVILNVNVLSDESGPAVTLLDFQ